MTDQEMHQLLLLGIWTVKHNQHQHQYQEHRGREVKSMESMVVSRLLNYCQQSG